MEQTKYDVFISYSRKDYVKDGNVIMGNVISIIKETLHQNAISYWMDEDGNLTGEKFAHIIAGKIRESLIFLFVCSHNSVASEWVDRELSVAVARKKHIIPFVCDDSYMDDKVIMFLAPLDRIEYFSNPQKELERLIFKIETKKKELLIDRLKEEIKRLVAEYNIHSNQQDDILKQLYNKNKQIGHESKKCPVCEKSVPIIKDFCERCGWKFSKLYGIDGSDIALQDKFHLTLSRTNWRNLCEVGELQDAKKKLEEEKVVIRAERDGLKSSLSDIMKKCEEQLNCITKKDSELTLLHKDNVSLQANLRKREIETEDLRQKYAELEKRYQNLKESSEKRLKEESQAVFREFSVCGVLFKMIRVESGSFMMGSPDNDAEAFDDEKIQHRVILSDYYIGETQVTQEQWETVMGNNPSTFKGEKHPVDNITWNCCQKFIKKLNSETGMKFHLPTEAQWEFAARGGNKSQGFKYAGSNTLDDVAWYAGNSGKGTHPVKTKLANELGLYDMSGNVWEWCQDWYGSYKNSSLSDPTGPSSGTDHVLRGGSWNDKAIHCRVAYREDDGPDGPYYFGFRIALEVDSESHLLNNEELL